MKSKDEQLGQVVSQWFFCDFYLEPSLELELIQFDAFFLVQSTNQTAWTRTTEVAAGTEEPTSWCHARRNLTSEQGFPWISWISRINAPWDWNNLPTYLLKLKFMVIVCQYSIYTTWSIWDLLGVWWPIRWVAIMMWCDSQVTSLDTFRHPKTLIHPSALTIPVILGGAMNGAEDDSYFQNPRLRS